MAAKVVVVGGEKGGTGKTTVSINLSIMSALCRYDTLLIDADKQGSSRKVIDRRNGEDFDPKITCVSILGKHLNSEIDRLAEKFDRIFIDVGGRDSVELRSALVAQSVSEWLSPMQPTDLDMDTLQTLDDLANISKNYNPKLSTRVLLNSCPTHAKVKTKFEAMEIIEEAFPHLGIFNTSLGHRIAYQYSISQHKSVVEFEADEYQKLPDYRKRTFSHKASKEIINVYNELFDEQFSPLIPEETKITEEA